MTDRERARHELRTAWLDFRRAWVDVKRAAKPLRWTLLTLAVLSFASSGFTVWLFGWPVWTVPLLSVVAFVVLFAAVYGLLRALVAWGEDS